MFSFKKFWSFSVFSLLETRNSVFFWFLEDPFVFIGFFWVWIIGGDTGVKFINIKKFKERQDHVLENLLIMVCGVLFLWFFLRPCTRSYFVISFKHYLISFKRVVSCWILSWQPLFWCYCSSWRVIFCCFFGKKRYLSVGVVTCWGWFFFPLRGFASLFPYTLIV